MIEGLIIGIGSAFVVVTCLLIGIREGRKSAMMAFQLMHDQEPTGEIEAIDADLDPQEETE